MTFPKTVFRNKKFINVIVETPAGSAAKYNYDEETGLFKLKKILPEGLEFPFHFGFIPNTKTDDGDPVDVLILDKNKSWPGCVIEIKVIGIIKAQQIVSNKTQNNDRIIGIPAVSKLYKNISSVFKLEKYIMTEIINFLESYTRLEKKPFTITGSEGPAAALKQIKKQIQG